MAKYHINPETGNANLCHAKRKCRFQKEGEPPVKHYTTKEEAQAAAESQLSQSHGGQAQRGQRKRKDTLTLPLQELPRELTPTPYHPEYERQVLAKANSPREEWDAFQREVTGLTLTPPPAALSPEEVEFMARARKLYGKSTATTVVTTPHPEEGIVPPAKAQEKQAEVARYRELLTKEREAEASVLQQHRQEVEGLMAKATPPVRSILREAFFTKPRGIMDPPVATQLEELKRRVEATGARLPEAPTGQGGGGTRSVPAKKFTAEELERVRSLSSYLSS